MNMPIRRIAVVGGPCSGKTDIITMLAKMFVGQLLVVPEVSEALLRTVMPVPGKHLECSPVWQRHHQRAICAVQQAAEEAWALAAEGTGMRVLLCDRGILDGAAYWPGGAMPFCDEFDLDYQAVLDRYSMVIHLESIGVSHPDLFERLRANNGSSRFETLEESQRLEAAVRQAWDDHPNRHIVQGTEDIAAKVGIVQHFIEGQLSEGT